MAEQGVQAILHVTWLQFATADIDSMVLVLQ